MNERYPIPKRDVQLGIRVLSTIMKSTYKEIKSTIEPVIQDQMKKALFTKRK